MTDIDRFLEAAHKRLLRDKMRADHQLCKALDKSHDLVAYKANDLARLDRDEMLVVHYDATLDAVVHHVMPIPAAECGT